MSRILAGLLAAANECFWQNGAVLFSLLVYRYNSIRRRNLARHPASDRCDSFLVENHLLAFTEKQDLSK